MTLEQIKQAIKDGKQVYWKCDNYQVIRDKLGQYLVKCLSNGHCTGLTNTKGILIDNPKDFYTC